MASLGLDKSLLLEMYTTIEKIRQFELKAVELYTEGVLPGFLHSCLGQEAAAAGFCALLNKDDYITSTHRGHGHVIAKGADLKKMMAELYGKITGYCRGKGGSMHIMDAEIGILGANGIVGGGIPIATGAGLSILLNKTRQVAVSFFGDGASNTGSFHESINLASCWNLPVIYVCENNLYAESTAQECQSNVKDIAVRAKSYGIYSCIADGNDVLDVYDKSKQVIERARNGEGPSIIEFKTYRWLGHYVGDPGVYRSKSEVEEWKAKEPLSRYRKFLIEKAKIPEQELVDIKKQVSEEVEESVRFAQESENPPLEVALEDILY